MSETRADRPCVVAPAGAVRIDAPLRRADWRTEAIRAAALASGTPVALWASGPLARLRCRRLALRSGLVLEREYVVLPTVSSASVFIEDSPVALRWFVTRARRSAPSTAAMGGLRYLTTTAGRRLIPYSLLGAIAPSRLAVGHRS